MLKSVEISNPGLRLANRLKERCIWGSPAISDSAKLGAKRSSRAARKRRDSPMRDLFALEYIKDFNATRAAIRAGYSRKTAASQGHRLLKSAAVGEAIARVVKKAEVSANRVMEELAAIAFADPGEFFDKNGLRPISEIPEKARRALASLSFKRRCDCHRREGTFIGLSYKIRFANKAPALKLLAKFLKIFP